MEIMIQTKNHMFSFGSYGYRKVTTHDWNAATEAFEILTLLQTGKMVKKADETQKQVRELLRSARPAAPTWDEGAWDDNHADAVTGLDCLGPDRDPGAWEDRAECDDPSWSGGWPDNKEV